ncbi:hypothetical protein RDI58_006221 [Solanum bulbocastanum]|uniref:Uncharacterized protein n=1 Tax=Solanum bulbocastanum TaxID=147425 RepID=A0AAN8UA87_SOLBU
MVEDHHHSAELHRRRRRKSPASSGLRYFLILLGLLGVDKFFTILTVISMLGGLIDQLQMTIGCETWSCVNSGK